MADTQTLLSICDRVHIVLTRKDTLGEIHLVSSHFLEWRQVLCAANNKTNRILELNGIGTRDLTRDTHKFSIVQERRTNCLSVWSMCVYN